MRAMKAMLGVSMLFVLTAIAVAEEHGAPQPTAEHEALETWVGSWSGEGDMKAGPFGAGGLMTWTEECSWFDGGKFHVVCTSEGTGPMGPMNGLGIVGYNPEKKVYTHYGVDNSGWSGYSEGTHSGDTWTFQSEESMGGKKYFSRFEMAMKSPTTMEFTWEMSEDGTTWTVMMEGTSTKE